MNSTERTRHNTDLLFEAINLMGPALDSDADPELIDRARFAGKLAKAIVQQDCGTLERLLAQVGRDSDKGKKLILLVKRMEINTQGYAL